MPHSLAVRSEAIGRIEGGQRLKDVAKAMSIPFSTVEKWYSKRKKGISLEKSLQKWSKSSKEMIGIK